MFALVFWLVVLVVVFVMAVTTHGTVAGFWWKVGFLFVVWKLAFALDCVRGHVLDC